MVQVSVAWNKFFRAREDRLFIISLLALLVGLIGGLVAEGLLAAIAVINNLVFFGQFSSVYRTPDASHLHGWLVLAPALGGLAVGVLIHYCSPEIQGDGIPEAMSVVLTRGSAVAPRVGFFKPLSAAITVGTGGPFGAEGPIIQTGGALGSILSQYLPMSPNERRTLLACGAAAGLAGVFKTPFAGAFMAIELLVFEFRARSFIPITLASLVGAMVAMAFRGAAPVFPVTANFAFRPSELPLFVALGVGCACLAWVMIRVLYGCEEFFESILHRWTLWFPLIPTAGGLLVGIIALFYPQVLGMGYSVIADLLALPHSSGHLIGVGVAKLAAFAIALGSGASGGTFAPALMIGGSLGAAFGNLAHVLLPAASSPGLYGMVATAALFGTIYRATPTAILFMLEVTGAYRALLPLILVCVVADLVAHYMMDTTINTERLVKRGMLVPDFYSVDPTHIFRADQVMTPGASPAASEGKSPAVYGDEAVSVAVMRMLDAKCDHCLVVERISFRPLGLLTASDALKPRQWELEQERPGPPRLRLSRRTARKARAEAGPR